MAKRDTTPTNELLGPAQTNESTAYKLSKSVSKTKMRYHEILLQTASGIACIARIARSVTLTLEDLTVSYSFPKKQLLQKKWCRKMVAQHMPNIAT